MKYLFLVMIVSTSAFSQSLRSNLVEISNDLNFEISKKGKCLHTRNQLTSIQLNDLFRTQVRNSVSYLRGKDVTAYWNCIYVKRNFKRDNKSFFITPGQLDSRFSRLSTDQEVVVKGKIKYVGLVNKKYHYDLSYSEGVVTAKVRVHFKYAKRINKQLAKQVMEDKFLEAEKVWNKKSPKGFRFKFDVVDNPSKSHFSVKLKTTRTRGPYDTRWSLIWSGTTIAHELGHMMGLDDEYDQITGSTMSNITPLVISRRNREGMDRHERRYYGYLQAMRCDKKSLMCNSSSGKLRKWHFYTIFKRFFQQNGGN